MNIEKLAEWMHRVWSNWYRYQRDNSTPENIARREKQSDSWYWDLSEQDKEKDREIVRKLFNL